MVDRTANLNEKRNKILAIIKQKGPCLPVQISREIGLSILLTSAILSEMVAEKELKISKLKVGGSPLYFIQGQESMLERFANYLPIKEREAFTLLKKKSLLSDGKVQPAYRVALRSIKDFAIPMKASTPLGDKIFWRFYSFSREKAVEEIRRLVYKEKRKPVGPLGKLEKERKEERKKAEAIEKIKQKEIRKREKEEQKKAKIKETEFVKKVYQYLQKNNITLTEEKELKRKNIIMQVRVNSNIGEFEMLLIAKDKKTINDTDLKLALSQGQNSKLSVLLLATGKLSKKAKEEIENFKSYLIFKQI